MLHVLVPCGWQARGEGKVGRQSLLGADNRTCLRKLSRENLGAEKREQILDGRGRRQRTRSWRSMRREVSRGCGHRGFWCCDRSFQAALVLKPGKTMVTPSATLEELRLQHQPLGLAWEMAKSKHSTRLHSKHRPNTRSKAEHSLSTNAKWVIMCDEKDRVIWYASNHVSYVFSDMKGPYQKGIWSNACVANIWYLQGLVGMCSHSAEPVRFSLVEFRVGSFA